MKLRKRRREHVFTDASAMDIRVLDEALCDLLEKTKSALAVESDPKIHELYEAKQLTAWSLLGLVLHVRRGDCNEAKCYHSASLDD
jgi:hypothetical protein